MARPLLLLFFYTLHTVVFHLLSFSNHTNYDCYLQKNEAKKKHDRKKPYSFFVVKHVNGKEQDIATASPVEFEKPVIAIPTISCTGTVNSNYYSYCLPDDSYKRYRLIGVLLI